MVHDEAPVAEAGSQVKCGAIRNHIYTVVVELVEQQAASPPSFLVAVVSMAWWATPRHAAQSRHTGGPGVGLRWLLCRTRKHWQQVNSSLCAGTTAMTSSSSRS